MIAREAGLFLTSKTEEEVGWELLGKSLAPSKNESFIAHLSPLLSNLQIEMSSLNCRSDLLPWGIVLKGEATWGRRQSKKRKTRSFKDSARHKKQPWDKES